MRTTIDLPDDLFRRAKSTAALRGLSLKEMFTSFVEAGLSEVDEETVEEEKYGHATPLPVVFPASLGPIRSLTNSEIEEILLQEDLARIGKH